ncbi:MAG: IS3 family transposase [Bacteroidota bacterium]
MPLSTRLSAIQSHSDLSLSRQCLLLGVNRGRLYYEPVPESELNLRLMRLMDAHYLVRPDKGPRRMQSWLARVHDLQVNIKRLNRLYYQVMGLQSVLPGPHTSKPAPGHKIYPYLLRGLAITRPNQVWQTDISYVGLSGGYLYLTAWIDVATRFVLAWSLSNTMSAKWCAELYEQAIACWGAPEIVNTDQGSQYTSEEFVTTVLKDEQTQLSMDGKGRATDNAFIERLWRTVKYEHIYLYDFADGNELRTSLENYFRYYNFERDHSSLDPTLPAQHYFKNRPWQDAVMG